MARSAAGPRALDGAIGGVAMNDTRHTSTRSGFDVVLGNPPFVNAIEGGVSDATKSLARFIHPNLGGTADLGYIFLDESVLLVSPRGRIGMIQPRAVLNAAPVVQLRRTLLGRLRPNMIYAPNRADLFPGAAVFVCALVIGPEPQCRVSRDLEPASATWHTGTIEGDNWWLSIGNIISGVTTDTSSTEAPVGSVFEVCASMTTGDAYDVKPFVVDESVGEGKKLITTGLIEPNESLWGKSACRYLKSDYQHPRITASDDLTKSLRRRLEKASRPKILVAGLSKVVECFVDAEGECIGAVSTYSIFHPQDDVAALKRLCDFLLTEGVSARFKAELGGNAMGGGNTTMKREFLEALPIPG